MGRTVMGGGDKRRNINGGNWEEDYTVEGRIWED